jgi:ubiquitin carboxyl-terminal hydrolase 14
VDLDPTTNGETFKLQLYSLTGVEPDRQKVLIKGGQLKDDTDLSTLNAKPGQTFMMMGTASVDAAVITAPKEKIKFMEDMTDAEAAKLEGATPAGLHNLGNTCYLNSTLQVLRSVPELQEDLAVYKPSPANGGASSLQSLSQFGLDGIGSSTDLTASLRDLYKRMSETQEGFSPLVFLNALRAAFPQFAQKSKTGHGYAQQDAEEAWSEIVSQLRQKLKIADPNDSTKTQSSFVDRYLAGSFSSVLSPPPEAAEKEKSVTTSESFLKLDCHIDQSINHLRDGILAGLSSKIEKRSDTLDRDATYTKTSKISRAPKYLTVHFVRFYWKREAQKKAKIMKKVTFPAELDLVEFCTDELKQQLIPVRDKVREIRKDEQDVERARKRQKLAHKQEEDRKAEADRMDVVEAAPIKKAQEAKERKEAEESGKPQEVATNDIDVYKTDAEYEAERAASIKAAKKELYAAIDPTLMADEGANKSGLYELSGVITHQGASADSGHYTSYVKKTARMVDDPKAPGGKRKEEDGKWWWFNDDKVSEVDAEKIETLSGGGKCTPRKPSTANLMTNCSLGESHSALILLYRAIDLPTKDEIED